MSTFLSDVFGVSGRGIIDHFIQHGQISAAQVAPYIKGKAGEKIDDIKIAVNGKVGPHQKEFLAMLVRRLDEDYAHITTIELKITAAIEDFQVQINQLDSVPGISITAAAAVLAEISSDMSNFKTSDHICSWAGLSPGNNESACKKKHTRN